MAVIALPNLAPQGSPGGPLMTWGLQSITALNRSPMNGVETTVERPGARWIATLKYEHLSEARRARMQQFLANCRGHGSRFYVPYYGWTNRGSISTSNLLTNSTFASGTTGWTGGGGASIAAQDGVLRVTRSDGATADYQARQSSITVSQYAGYVARAIMLSGFGPTNLTLLVADGTTGSTSAAAAGYKSTVFFPTATSLEFVAYESSTSGRIAGHYFGLANPSLSRCAIVDNAVNLLLQSDTLENASWSRVGLSTVTANATTGHSGSATGERLVENGSASAHYIGQTASGISSSGLLDYAAGAILKADVRSWAFIQMSTGTGAVTEYFNLSSGAVGASGSTGSGWTGRRAFVINLGDGWFYCYVIARKTSADTSIAVNIGAATADGTSSYTGGGAGGIYIDRAGLAQKSVPWRAGITTSSATTGTAQTGGGLHLSGLPVSTTELLLPGDLAEVITGSSSQLVRARSQLNSDASGRGYFEFEAPIRVSPSDGAAVIFHNPICRMLLDANTVQWTEHSGGFCDLEFTAVEDTYP